MSTTATTIPASQARKSFYTILSDVATKLKRFTITRRGKPQAVVIHPDEVASWEETMDVLADKKLVVDIRNGLRDIKAGRTVSSKQLLQKLGLSAKDIQ